MQGVYETIRPIHSRNQTVMKMSRHDSWVSMLIQHTLTTVGLPLGAK